MVRYYKKWKFINFEINIALLETPSIWCQISYDEPALYNCSGHEILCGRFEVFPQAELDSFFNVHPSR